MDDKKKQRRKRALKMVQSMTLAEKSSQMVHEARGISRMNIPAYNWWSECLHGVGRAGIATVFPQAIGLAAIFDEDFMHQVADSISDEVRAKHHEAIRQVESRDTLKFLPDIISGFFYNRKFWYRGLTCWSPNVNIFRDPRWGRGHETYGEDPYLSGRLGVAFVKGLQGDHPDYLKTVATPKHFAVHSGPEKTRHSFDARVSMKDLHETYLPAFKDCIQEGKAASVMSAYNAVNGEPASSNSYLLQDILRDDWGFEGFVVSDCGAVRDIYLHHRKTRKRREAAAMAVNAGCDLNCGYMYHLLKMAVHSKMISETTIDTSLIRLIEARLSLGMFDPPVDNPYSSIPSSVIDCDKHRTLALKAAEKSMVLLKNDGILPLPSSLSKIAVIGPNADSLDVLLGNYNGTPSAWTTPLEGIKRRCDPDTEILYAEGCPLSKKTRRGFPEAIRIAESADVIILCLGLDPRIEGEEGDAFNSDAGGDKVTLEFPGVQGELLEALSRTSTPVITVVLSGSPLELEECGIQSSALIQAWYPGEEGGYALARLLYGDESPSGRLPVTFVRSIDDLPPFEDYSMEGRTYRFLKTEPLYPFGFGLSYTDFEYSKLETQWIEQGAERFLEASIQVKNIGQYEGDEVVQFYFRDEDASVRVPLFQLCGFKRFRLQADESKTLRILIKESQFMIVDEAGQHKLEEGLFTLYAGGSQPDKRSCELMGRACLEVQFSV